MRKAFIVIVLFCAACGGGSPNRTGGSVIIKTFAFRPQRVTVDRGATVTWTNTDQILHTATSGTGPDAKTSLFNGSMDGAGKTFRFRFSSPGTYPYFCTRHPTVPSMHGSVVVT